MPIRNISILESTGPFGLQALKIVRENPKRFRVVGLSAGTNLSLLATQIAQFRPEIVAISDADQLDDLEDAISAAELTPMLRAGPAGVLDVARYASAHTIIVDSAASNDRQSVRAAIMAGKDIILAAQDRSTKGVDGFLPLARRHRVTLLAAGQSQSSILAALRAGTGGSGQGHAPAIAEPAVQAAFARLDDQTTRAIRDGYRYLSLCTLGDHGLQSSIALDPEFRPAISLGEVAAGIFPPAMPEDQVRVWQARVLPKFASRLGTALTAENFTAMLALKVLKGGSSHANAFKLSCLQDIWAHDVLCYGRLAPDLMRFLFFRTTGFASDTDCTGVALTGLHGCGAIDDDDLAAGARELLASAAVRDLSAEANHAPEKAGQGALVRGVFKTYFEDETFVRVQQGGAASGAAFRGCKHDAVAVVNAMPPVLLALQRGLLRLDDIITLQEFGGDADATGPVGRSDTMQVGDIVAANWRFIAAHLDDLQQVETGGTRYYPYGETFLCFLAEVFLQFPAEAASAIDPALVRARIAAFLDGVDRGEGSVRRNPLRLAQLAIAADSIDAAIPGTATDPVRVAALKRLLSRQALADGSWPPIPCFTLGTNQQAVFGSGTMTTIFALRALEGAGVGSGRR